MKQSLKPVLTRKKQKTRRLDTGFNWALGARARVKIHGSYVAMGKDDGKLGFQGTQVQFRPF